MQYLDLTLTSPEANLALDEALFLRCEGGLGGEVLRVWEAVDPFVVLGYGNHAAREACLEVCDAAGVPVLRRISGGGAVLQASGCLNYTLVLRLDGQPGLEGIPAWNRHIMQRQCAALVEALSTPVEIRGDIDLVLGDRKVSGNAQRRGKSAVLFHGTLLLAMDLTLVSRFLPFPSRQPTYRGGRDHGEFLANLECSPATIKQALRRAWSAARLEDDLPMGVAEDLVREKYGVTSWNRRW